jgi:SWI/SNF-related matrix-associated actin-dependent regulator 1 of chromatin subfamily A
MASIGKRLRTTLKTKPKKYQIQAVRHLEQCPQRGRGILGDDMGLGKTYEAMGWAAINPDAWPVVVVCPSNVKFQWAAQFAEHAGIHSTVLEGTKPYLPKNTTPVVIINYKILSTAKWPRGKRKGARPHFPWVKTIQSLRPKTLIIDEFQYIKNRSALRTRAVVALGRKMKHVIGASGTPIEKAPIEFFPMLNLIDKTEFPSVMKYAFQYCAPKKAWRGHGWDFSGAENLDELHQRIAPYIIRRMKTDVAKELPPKIRTILPITINNRREYQKAEQNFLQWVSEKMGQDHAENLAEQGAIGITRMGALKRIAAEGKIKEIERWIKHYIADYRKKPVVFCVHKKITKALIKKFPHAALIDGSVASEKRPDIIDRFQNDPKCQLFIGQLRAAGVGLDGLQKMADTVVFAELGWNFSEHEQAEDRLLRIGQCGNAVNVIYMIGAQTIEEHILQVIQRKHDICNKVLNGDSTAAQTLFSTARKNLFERIEK